MIAMLKGQIAFRGTDWIVVDTGGVGYEVMPTHVDEFALGQEVQLWIYTSVKEDAIQLFGMESLQERDVFVSLLKVSGIGPKLACKILSACTWQRLLENIDRGDTAALTAIPKVGRKTAEQIIVELKGKSVTTHMPASTSSRSDILSALVNLGYKPVDVERVVRALPADVTLEQGVRDGLKQLSQI